MKALPWLLVALLAGALGFVLGTRGATPAVAAPDPSSVPVTNANAVYQRAIGAVRTVRSSNADLSGFDARGIGTAFHIGGGYYVTAAHVVADGYAFFLDDSARTVTRATDNARLKPATVVGKDAASDVALVKGEPAAVSLEWAAADPKVGDVAYAIGNPFGIAPGSFSNGIISGMGRAIGTERGTLAGMLQMDTPVNPGNSGGPLLDAAGRVIGVVSANIAQTNQNAGVGFAVPVMRAKAIVDALRAGGAVKRASLGVIAGNGTAIGAVQPGELGARAGLQQGDEILEVAGSEVESFEEINAIIGAQPLGSTVEVVIKRGNGTRRVNVELTAP
jgi:S1-C subfamily serine protease